MNALSDYTAGGAVDPQALAAALRRLPAPATAADADADPALLGWSAAAGLPLPQSGPVPPWQSMLADGMRLGLSLAPGSGEVMAIQDSADAGGRGWQSLQAGDYAGAASSYAQALAAGLGAVPVLGGVVRGVGRPFRSGEVIDVSRDASRLREFWDAHVAGQPARNPMPAVTFDFGELAADSWRRLLVADPAFSQVPNRLWLPAGVIRHWAPDRRAVLTPYVETLPGLVQHPDHVLATGGPVSAAEALLLSEHGPGFKAPVVMRGDADGLTIRTIASPVTASEIGRMLRKHGKGGEP